ncbi:hypothetical protein [Streptomyces sp. NPDC050704]|uniref:LexA family protein n=1 Tax=Streptomyces sp. NPDC050704 TaxID=3157219 RepID=UPI00341F2712
MTSALHPLRLPPGVREIGAAVGLLSPSSGLYQLLRLDQTGAVVRAGGTWGAGYRLG